MKGIFVLQLTLVCFFYFLSSVTTTAQDNNRNNSFEILSENNKSGLPIDDSLFSFVIKDGYDLKENNNRMLFLQLAYKGIPVFGKIASKVIANNNLPVNVTNLACNNILFQEFKGHDCADSKSALAALFRLLKISDLELPQPQQIVSNKFSFSLMGLSETPIIAEKVWYPIKDDEFVLSWQFELPSISSARSAIYWINAFSLELLAQSDYTVEEPLVNDATTRSLISFDSLETAIPSEIITSPVSIINVIYNVIPFPIENVAQTTGFQFNPWLGNSNVDLNNSLWHFDGIQTHDSTRGNNVWAQEDHDNNNNTKGRCALSQSIPPSLSFIYAFDSTLSPLQTTNSQFAITNLFYWCNYLHDFFFNLGFDEASGNFQFQNSQNGIGNDGLIADAQDAGRFNNANFTTPPDGISPRMQLYLFNKTNPYRDADLDNGIIVHEYTHGVTNRLTGGPSTTTCLGNAEQPGEGWSDYFALMLTTNWATSNVNDGILPRSIGTYILGQPLSGKGIRDYYYATNMLVNPLHYGMISSMDGNAHKIGEVWCSALWDLTWLLVGQYGIDNNLMDTKLVGGNTIAMKLVLEGLRLQPCRPGFLDARNAILQADSLFFRGRYSCLIWKAFAGRGMGINAIQGSSNNTVDQVADFNDCAGIQMITKSNFVKQHDGMEVKLIHVVKSGPCKSILGFRLIDTLPVNATYISGGHFDSQNSVISFPVNIEAADSSEYSFIFKIKDGSYFPATKYFIDSVRLNHSDSFWISDSNSTFSWQISNQQFHSGPYSFFSPSPSFTTENTLTIKQPIVLPSATATELSFVHQFQLESGWDGGVVELSTDSGLSWTDLGAYFISGGYNSKIKTSANPLSGRFAFTGISNGFEYARIDLSSWAGKSVLFRFRMATDESISMLGWFIDDIVVKDSSRVLVYSTLSDSNTNIISKNKTTIEIMPTLICSCLTNMERKKGISVFRRTNKRQKK